MGKTVKGRVFISITAFICVIAICLIANKGVPSLYASHREKVAAQDSATRVVEQVNKPKTTTATTAATTTTTAAAEAVTEDANVYDIAEDSASEEDISEDTNEEEPEEEETTAPDNQDNSSKSFLDKVIDFFTSLFEAITSGTLLEKIKEFFSGIFGKIGL